WPCHGRFRKQPLAGLGLSSQGVVTLDATKVIIANPDQPLPESAADACLVHIYPTGPGMGTRYRLGGVPLVVGRDAGCEIRVHDDSASRRHAVIQQESGAYWVIDLQSTNGTFVNDARVSSHLLCDGDYLHIGNCIWRYLAGGNVEAQYHEEIHRLAIID